MTQLKPALTAEEWDYILDPDPRRREWAPHPTYTAHGEAARLLYGQPFGFSREDVDAVRLVHVSRPEIQARLEFMADRIEALLPPFC